MESIIDNVSITMHDKLIERLTGAHTLDIAVGYFHVSGFNELIRHMNGVRMRLVMGNETDADTAAHLRKGHKPKTKCKPVPTELYEFIKSGRLKVRIYTHSKFHAKAYIIQDSCAFVGSSNLSKAGLGRGSSNLELNLMVSSIDELSAWYENIWNESVHYNSKLIKVHRRRYRRSRRL